MRTKISNCEKIFKKFIKKNNIPFVLTWNADDFIDSSHPMYFGKPGAFGSRGSNFIVQNCDFYLSMEQDFHIVTGYDVKGFAKNVKHELWSILIKILGKKT